MTGRNREPEAGSQAARLELPFVEHVTFLREASQASLKGIFSPAPIVLVDLSE